MTMANWNWNGSRWWKFDFHSHTPASDDYGKGLNQKALKGRTPEEWLLDYMQAGIDCVVVTDHNSGDWVDKLKLALNDLTEKEEQPTGFRPIHLFPGVEISVNGGIHLLGILSPNKGTSDIDSLIGATGFSGKKGSSNDVTTKSVAEVAAEIEKCGAIAIAAHVDGDSGLFKLQGTTLNQALGCNALCAIEVLDPSSSKPALYKQTKVRYAEVLGSDSHHPTGQANERFPGSHYTWVKMGSPTIEGLRLALLDGRLSIRRSDEDAGNPNEHAGSILESIQVCAARYMGRADPFTISFNPWLNAIVGGRGTGKSTVVEFLRLALRRVDELPEELKSDFEKYGNIYPNREDSGLVTAEARIAVTYRKNGSRFRIQWSPAGDLDPIQEQIDGTWRRAEGDIRQRFPVRIYSQKQVFQLAKTPLALLKVVDESPEVDRHSWKERWKEEETRFLSLRTRVREIQSGLAEEPRLRGELDDVRRKLAIFEEAGHAEVLKEYQRRRRQEQAVEGWEADWSPVGDQLRQTAEELVPDPVDATTFDLESEPDSEIQKGASEVRSRLAEIRKTLEGLADQTDHVLAEWRNNKNASSWKKRVEQAVEAYQSLRAKLAQERAGDPAGYGELVQRRQTIEQRLKDLGERKKQVDDVREQANTSLQRLSEIRRELTESRKAFLQSILEGNTYVRIRVLPYGARDTVESEVRSLLQRAGGGFEKDIGSPGGEGLLGALYRDGPQQDGFERSLQTFKERIRNLALGQFDGIPLGDQRFATHLRKLLPEAVDRVDVWFPEDSLDVQYSPTGDGHNFRSIQEGSPGQRTAALLAFLLSYGEEPLLLDQPEDDLDNHLIYNLIVNQLREVKHRRQIVVVTHNPNIVVNGDAELIVALDAHNGETHKECDASLQEKAVRNTICAVMEGGREAFERRYLRIALEGRRV